MAHVAVLLGPDFEDSEFTHPVDALRRADHTVEILGRKAGETVRGKSSGTEVEVEAAAADRDPKRYDALLIPGGYSPDQLRTEAAVVDFVRAFEQSNKPIAAICHGPQLLIEAGVVGGRRMTSWPSVRTDLKNAGARVVDAEVCVDENIITSRKPDDLDAFSDKLLAHLG